MFLYKNVLIYAYKIFAFRMNNYASNSNWKTNQIYAIKQRNTAENHLTEIAKKNVYVYWGI